MAKIEIELGVLQDLGSKVFKQLAAAKQSSAAWLDYLKDFLLSRRVFDITDGKRRPLSVSGGGFPMGADQNYERFIRFTAMDSYEDQNFTSKL